MATDSNSLQQRLRIAVSAVTGHQPEDLDADQFLESDLGIDSIKMVELTQSLLLIVAEPLRERFMAEVPTDRLMQVQTLRELETIFQGWDGAPTPSPATAGIEVASSGRGWEQVASEAAFLPESAPAPTAPPPSLSPQSRGEGAGATDLAPRVFALISQITGHNPDDLDLDLFLEGDLGIDSIKMVELSSNLLTLVPAERRDAFTAQVPTDQLMQVQTLREIVQLFAPWQTSDNTASGPSVAVAAVPAPQSQLETSANVASWPGNALSEGGELNLLPSQYPFLVSHWAVSTCSLCSRVRLQGPFDLQLAQRAWNDLLGRHPALRARFVIPAEARSFKEYRYEVQAQVQVPALALTDLRHLPRAQQDEAVAAEVQRNVNAQWALSDPLLHRFFAWRLADDLHEVFFTNHHLISDGLSNQQVMREFLALYAAAANGQPAALPPATSLQRYREVVDGINAWHDPAEDQAITDLLKRQGKQSFVWNPNNRPRAEALAKVRNYRFRLDKGTTQTLQRLTGELRVSMNSVLVGAYLRTVAGFVNEAKPIFLNIPTSGRVYQGIDASGIIGCFAQNLALDFAPPAASEAWDTLLERVHRGIESAIGQGVDRAQTRSLAHTIRDRFQLEHGRIPEAHGPLIRAGMKSNLFLPYIGNTHIAEQYAGLSVVDYQAATVTNAGTLDTVIEQFNGHLEMTTNYDANHYDIDFIAKVAEAFLVQLRSLAVFRTPQLAQVAAPRTTSIDSVQADQVRQVAEEIMHRALTVADLDKDLEADLGLDSLERIRIVSRLEQFSADRFDRQALLSCRSLGEMVAQLGGEQAAPALVSAPASHDADTALMPYRQIIAQCARTPKAVAVQADGASLTYDELHWQSNQLANQLRALGVTRGSLVGVMAHRGINMQIALLGILKAGGGYVPLDPDYPSDRIAYIMEHAQLTAVLTETAVATQLAACLSPSLPLRHLVYLDEKPFAAPSNLHSVGRAEWRAQPDTDLAQVSQPDDTMVVLYTSGSTGRPKGVVLGHRGYANRHDWHQQLFQLQPGERVAQKTSICFDISVWELFWPLQVGGTVCPVSTATLRDPWALAQWIRDNGIHVMHFVPSLFGEFLNAVEAQTIAFPALRQLVFSGEAMPVTHVRRWFARFGFGAKMANLYGPTEASIDVSAWQMDRMPDLSMARVPIGHAMPNVQLLILDENMQRVPQGEQGELWIGGIQLAHGYLHDAQRTADSFRVNPFPDVPCPTLYKTGDLCVQLPDGSFDYRGRVDSQVKIRGFRVELGEIESVLGTHPAVREAAVLAVDHGDGHLRLEAWLSGEYTEPRALREHLAKKLPAYMLPNTFDWLPSLPKNQNGKLDRKAIAAHGKMPASTPPAAPVSTAAVEAPAQTLEDQIVANTIDFPLGPAQSWLLNYFEPPYQWAGFSRFRYLQPLDIETFNRALRKLTQKHAALRSVFHQKGGVWHQNFPEPRAWPQAEVYDGTHLPPTVREEQLRALIVERVKGLRLDGNGPLWSVLVIKEAEDRYDICIVGHHIISDMLGNGVAFKSLWQLYSECLAGEDREVHEDPPLFVTYLEALEKKRTRDAVARYVDYWTKQFPATDPAFNVPLDHRNGENTEASTASERFVLDAVETANLQRARQQYGSTLYHLLLAPLYRGLAEWSGNPKVALSQRTHGRDLGDGATFFECVGNFAVNYPLAVQVDAQSGWQNLLQAIKQGFDAVPLNGISYDLVADRLPGHLYPDNKLTPVRANYLGNRELPKSKLFEFDSGDWDQRFNLPEQKRSALIEVFFSIGAENTLQVELAYSSNFHRAETIRRVGERYMQLLRDVLTQAPTAKPMPAVVQAAPAQLVAANVEVIAPLSAAAPAPTTSKPLTGKIAVITGAGRGIGRDMAIRFAEQGAKLVLVSRSSGPLEETLQKVRRVTPDAIAIAADVTQEAAVETMMRQAIAHFGRVDILINNAGANHAMLLAESDPKAWREMIDINLMAAYLCSRSVLPQMMEQGGGKIVNLGSAASVIGYPLFSAYCAAKHAVVGLTKSLAEEVKQKNIQVNVVCPAFVDTRMTPAAFRGASMPVEQVAEVVLFLASKAADGITGETLNIFGKQDMYSYGSDKMSTFKSITRDFKPGVAA